MEPHEKLADRVCRLCLKYVMDNTMIPLFNTGSLSYYGQAVLPFANIDLVEDSDLPHSMCLKCLILLQHCISFKFMCEESDKRLKQVKNCIRSGSCVPHNKKELQEHIKVDVIIQPIKEEPKEEEQVLTDTSENDDYSAIYDYFDKEEQVVKRRKQFKYPVNIDKDGRQVCKLCNKSYETRGGFIGHMRSHGKRHVCDQCGKHFKQNECLRAHLLIIHGIGKGLKCPHCTHRVRSRFDLKEHIRIHTGERPFKCNQCGLTFRRKAIFQKHVIKHGNKTIKCDQCPEMFYTRYNMLLHCNNVHERQYMYPCYECGVLYANTKVVRKHLLKKHCIPRDQQKKIARVKTSDLNHTFNDDQTTDADPQFSDDPQQNLQL